MAVRDQSCVGSRMTLCFPLLAASPTAAPAALHPPAAADKPYYDQQQDGTDRGVDDRADYSCAQMDVELRQQPVADEGAGDTDDKVADQAKTCSLDNFAGQPAGNQADEHDDKKAFIR